MTVGGARLPYPFCNASLPLDERLDDLLRRDPLAQKNGVSFIQDLRALDAKLVATMMQPATLVGQARLAHFITRSFPCKWGHLVVVDAPLSFNALWLAVRPFFPDWLAAAVRFVSRPACLGEIAGLFAAGACPGNLLAE